MGHTTAAATQAHASTLRLSGYLLTLLHSTDTPEAVDLARTVSADPAGVGLDTLERVGGLFRVPPAHLLKESAA